jgi:hypothetical protein
MLLTGSYQPVDDKQRSRACRALCIAVIPAKAGIQNQSKANPFWIPVYTGMTEGAGTNRLPFGHSLRLFGLILGSKK